MDDHKKRETEKKLVGQMIGLYCRRKHKSKTLCYQCQELLDYAQKAIDGCPFMQTKTFCSSCSVHCYKKDMRERIKEVMKFSGPRMLFIHPITVVRHVMDGKRKNTRRNQDED